MAAGRIMPKKPLGPEIILSEFETWQPAFDHGPDAILVSIVRIT